MLTGCITFNRPKGDWAYPVDLELPAGVLNGAVIAVRCGAGEPDEREWNESVLEGCRQTAKAVRSLGATVVAEEVLIPARAIDKANQTEQKEEEDGYVDVRKTKLIPEMSVVYIDRGIVKDRCWMSFPLFLLTWTLFPCVVDKTVFAELRIYDRNNILMTDHPLQMDMKTIIGIPSGYFALVRLYNGREYKAGKAATADNLYQFIQNTVHAHHRKVMLARAGGAVRD
jgi:hypothetical protein